MVLHLSFIMDTSVVTKESVFVKVEPMWSEDSSGVPEMIPDVDNLEMENTMTENVMNSSFERSNSVIKEEIGNFHSVTEITPEIKTLEEDTNEEDVKIETVDEECNTPAEALQDVVKGALLTDAVTYSCDSCAKTFSQKKYLMRHLIIHTGERPHICTICNSAFIQPEHLKNHFITHTTEKPYKCLTCGCSFKRSHDLRKHDITHTDSRPFCCSICGNSFRRSSDLRSHERTHTDRRPFCCTFCGSSFRRASHLKRHENTHAVTKPVSC